MKRLMAGVLVVGLLAVLVAWPTPADARPRGHFWGGVAVGAVTGLVFGGIFAPRVYAAPPVVYYPTPVYVAPPPVVYQPAPVYYPAPVYAAPPPVCSDYWVDQYWNGYGWTPGHWQRTCR